MYKKIVFAVLVLAQLSLAANALAAATPEMTLFENSLALTGENLSQQELQTRLADLLAGYEKTAALTGQAERMEQALVSLNLYTPQQAHQLALEAEDFGANTKQAGFSESAATAELVRLAGRLPAGAQFSACDLAGQEMLWGGFAGVVGGLLWACFTSNVNGDISSGTPQDLPHDQSVALNGKIVTLTALAVIVDGIVIRSFATGCGG